MLEILRAKNVEFGVIEYLKKPLGREELTRLLDLLAVEPAELVRKDKQFKKLGLSAEDHVTRGAVVDLLLEHPALMQRPVIVRGDRAVIGRPSERVNELLES